MIGVLLYIFDALFFSWISFYIGSNWIPRDATRENRIFAPTLDGKNIISDSSDNRFIAQNIASLLYTYNIETS